MRRILSWTLFGCLALAGPTLRADDVTLTRADGSALNLSDFRGKQPVVLLFMRGFGGKVACFYCGAQTREYRTNFEKFTALGAAVLMVLPGNADAAGYLKKVGESDAQHPDPLFAVPFPVLADRDFSACRAFHVNFDPATKGPFPVSEPATIVLGKDGAVLYEYHGKKPADRPAADAILEVLRTGAAPKPAATATNTGKRPTLAWVGYEEGMQAAREGKKPILLEFYAGW